MMIMKNLIQIIKKNNLKKIIDIIVQTTKIQKLTNLKKTMKILKILMKKFQINRMILRIKRKMKRYQMKKKIKMKKWIQIQMKK
jgi:hypothetical protein